MEIFAEPGQTKFDLRFSIGSIPVRVHPFFWIGTLILSLHKSATLLSIAIWLPVVFVSILVHELGHVWAYSRYGRSARVSVNGMGGLAISEGGADLGARQRIVVAAAGPFAGFIFGAVVMLIVERLGYRVDVLGHNLIEGAAIPSLAAWLVVQDIFAINLIWGLVNLAPVHPLDGSTIAYHAFYRRDVTRGRERSVRMSFMAALAIALAGLVFRETFVAILFALLAFSSYQALAQMDASALELPAGWGKRWRKIRRAREQKLKVIERKRLDKKLVETIRQSDLHEEERPSPDVERTARELLKTLNEEIGREMKKRK